MEAQVVALDQRLASLASLPAVVAGLGQDLERLGHGDHAVGEAIAGLAQRLDNALAEMVAADRAVLAGAGEQVDALSGRIEPLAGLPGQVAGVALEIDRLGDELQVLRRAVLDEVDSRTTPLRAAVAEVERTMAGLMAQARELGASADASASGVEGLDDRLQRLEPVPAMVDGLVRDLGAVSRGLAEVREEAVRTSGAQLQEVAARVESLETLRTDIEGLYAALYQVAETVNALRRDTSVP
jgi:archaellum component FlaC